MSENELIKCSRIYSTFDRNGDNKVPTKDLKRILISYGLNLSNDEFSLIQKNFQKEKFKDTFSLEEFYSLVQDYQRDHGMQRKELLDSFIQLEEQGENFEQHTGNIVIEELIH
jgi:Ca2+-binding EF-hand superfamily protein